MKRKKNAAMDNYFGILYLLYSSHGITIKEISNKLNISTWSVYHAIFLLENKYGVEIENINQQGRKQILIIKSYGAFNIEWIINNTNPPG